jgi:ParB-like chromosome segregation protein Spo0J
MKQTLSNRDLRTLRVLSEYGFTDAECAQHLGVSPLVVRRMRGRLGLDPRNRGQAILRDRDIARRAARMNPAQPELGGRRRHAGPVILRMVDDRVMSAT